MAHTTCSINEREEYVCYTGYEGGGGGGGVTANMMAYLVNLGYLLLFARHKQVTARRKQDHPRRI